MFNNKNEEYLERARMHEQLAAATADLMARKMHLAMAAEYRRKAMEDGPLSLSPPSSTGPILKLSASLQ